MKKLYLKISELLAELPNIRWVDFECGQLQEERPPILYPAALVTINLPSVETIDPIALQQVRASFTITLVFKALGETNANAPVKQREHALTYFDTVAAVFEKLQGYTDENFYHFSRISLRNTTVRKGLKVVEMNFETSWRECIASA